MIGRPPRDPAGIRSPQFARLIAFQIPVGLAFVLIGQLQLRPAFGRNLLTGVGIFIMVYAVIVLGVLFLLRRQSSQRRR